MIHILSTKEIFSWEIANVKFHHRLTIKVKGTELDISSYSFYYFYSSLNPVDELQHSNPSFLNVENIQFIS